MSGRGKPRKGQQAKRPGTVKQKKYTYTTDDLRLAIAGLQEGASFGEMSKKYGIPTTTLFDYKHSKSIVGVSKKGRALSIPKEVEDKIVAVILDCAEKGFPMTKRMVLERVGRLCYQAGFKTQFRNFTPSEKYWRGLKKRHPELVIRSPECCTHKRLKALTREKMDAYFDELHQLIRDNNLHPSDIWNMDETNLQFTHKPQKVIAKRGQRQLYSRTSDSKESVTIVACINANGDKMPAMCICKGKSRKAVESFFVHLAPEDTLWTYQDKAWMENELGLEWYVYLGSIFFFNSVIIITTSIINNTIITTPLPIRIPPSLLS